MEVHLHAFLAAVPDRHEPFASHLRRSLSAQNEQDAGWAYSWSGCFAHDRHQFPWAENKCFLAYPPYSSVANVTELSQLPVMCVGQWPAQLYL
jgi:hypothetical protein